MPRVHFIPALPHSGSIRLAAFQMQNSRFRDSTTGLHTAYGEMKSTFCATALPPALFQHSAGNVFLHDPMHQSAGVRIVRAATIYRFPTPSTLK